MYCIVGSHAVLLPGLRVYSRIASEYVLVLELLCGMNARLLERRRCRRRQFMQNFLDFLSTRQILALLYSLDHATLCGCRSNIVFVMNVVWRLRQCRYRVYGCYTMHSNMYTICIKLLLLLVLIIFRWYRKLLFCYHIDRIWWSIEVLDGVTGSGDNFSSQPHLRYIKFPHFRFGTEYIWSELLKSKSKIVSC